MKNVILEINGQKLEVSYPLLKALARNVGSEEYYAPLVKALLDLKIPSLTRLLVDNRNLTMEDLDALWGEADWDIKLAILEESNYIENLNDAQCVCLA